MVTGTAPRADDEGAKTRRYAKLQFLGVLLIMAIGAASVFATRQFHLGWPGSLAALILIMGLTFLLMRNAQRRALEMGCGSPAMTRYGRRMMASGLIYMVTLFAAIYAYRQLHVTGLALWVAALAASAGVIGMIWAMARLVVEETDEYIRFRTTKAALFATGGLLLLGTIWGFLEMFGLVVHLPLWTVVPIFAVMLGLGNFVPWVRS